MTWYSAMLSFLITIGVDEVERRCRSLILLRASDHASAFSAALERGRAMEQSYLNGQGEWVQWRLELVETIDQLDDVISDGREIYAEPFPPPPRAMPQPAVPPEEIAPGSSGV